AAAAIEMGACEAVLCVLRARPTPHDPAHRPQQGGRRLGATSGAFGAPEAEFDVPYGHVAQNTGYAMIAQRYKAVHGYDDRPIGPASKRAFAMAGLKPADMDMAQVYDCYTITVLLTLEDAGFAEKGKGQRFVAEHDLTWRGDFPLNTHGGQLSFGQAGMAGGA